jgi:hypothetical protein
MMLLLVLFGVGALLEIALFGPGFLWRLRHYLAFSALVVVAFSAGLLMVWQFNLWSLLLVMTGFYRIFNHLRIVEGRMHERYLRSVTWRTSAMLLLFQAAIGGLWFLWAHWHQTGHIVWLLVAVMQLLVAALLWSTSVRRLRRTAWPKKTPSLPDAELPTLTVAIPARNETEDLQACLESLVLSDYPKLEILVLDDCSQTRRTPEIIRSFAHDGVRFIAGEEHTPIWQPKNQAYDQLLREASGEYVLFCGVDVRFAPQSLRQLAGLLVTKKKKMMSLLPWRALVAERRFAVVQAMRYLWELTPPRRLFRRPPVLSTCWIARKDDLARAGGFVAVARSIVPEAHFAKVMAKDDDSYSFMRASRRLGIESTKPAREQYDTAIRMRYPQLHRRPENVVLLTLAYLFLSIMPFVIVVLGFGVSIGAPAQYVAAMAAVVNVVTYTMVVRATRTGSAWLGLLSFPIGVVYDLLLLHISMYKYEFSVVDWKGRNVCVPAMHVIPHLPKI